MLFTVSGWSTSRTSISSLFNYFNTSVLNTSEKCHPLAFLHTLEGEDKKLTAISRGKLVCALQNNSFSKLYSFFSKYRQDVDHQKPSRVDNIKEAVTIKSNILPG